MQEFNKIVTLLPGLLDSSNSKPNKELRVLLDRYLKYYRLPASSVVNNNILLDIGKLLVDDFEIVIQIYQLKKTDCSFSKGIVLFIHGYLDHVGLYGDYFQFLINNQYIVVAVDLPGHGLSTGKLGDIVDFGQYVNCIEDVVIILQQRYADSKIPFYISGFSAGAAWTIEYLLRNRHRVIFSKVILLAPLLKVPFWKFKKTASYLSVFIKFVTRQPKKISHDYKFLNFIKYNDPLQARFVPLRWVKALHNWGLRLPKYKALDIPMLIIQGTADQTIDWKYNIPMLSKIFPNHCVHYIYGGYHNLCNESENYRAKVFVFIANFLDAP